MKKSDGDGRLAGDGGSRQDRDTVSARKADLDALGLGVEPRTEVMRSLGEGGAGKVEAVFDHVLRRTAAKKSLLAVHERNPVKLRQFVREARITSQLDHPSIVPVHDLGADPSGRLFFTLKLVEGRTLSQLIDGWRNVGVEESTLLDVLDSLVKVCNALSLAHSRGVVHCDVKPENIMIGDYGETYLMDWGAALVLPESRSSGAPSWMRQLDNPRPSLPGDSQDDTIGGTPNYMAPEQALGEAELIGPRTDVFGLGATLYEVLTGRSPYADIDGYLAIEFAAKACYSPLAELIEEEFIPPLLERVIARSMASNIEERYHSVEQMRADLVRYTRGGGEFPVVRFEPGTVIVGQGDEADCAYIISRGHCDVVKHRDGQQSTVRRLGPGEVFGETALLSPGPRTADVIAVDEVSVQVIQRDVLSHELDSTRPWLSKLVRTVASRFREVDARGDRERGPPGPLHTAKQVTMHLLVWGRPGVDGSLEMAWSTLSRELAGDDQAVAESLMAHLEPFASIRIDPDRDRISLSEPQAFAAYIGEQLQI